MHVPKKRQLQFRHFYRSVWRNASREKHAENEVDSFRTGQGTEATGTGSLGHMLNTYPMSATHTVRGLGEDKQPAAAYDSFVVGWDKQMNARLNSRAKQVFSRDNTSRIQVDAFEYSPILDA